MNLSITRRSEFRVLAFYWLNRAFDERSYLLALYLPTDARLDRLHSDPRFDEVRKRIGLPAPNDKR